jgi:integrase
MSAWSACTATIEAEVSGRSAQKGWIFRVGRFVMPVTDLERDKGAAAVLPMLTVTGARLSEIMLAAWENVDFDRGMLTVPRSKNGRPRYIPLSPVAVAILERQAIRRLPDNVCPMQMRWMAPAHGI